jgi:uncharacterized protein (TIGR02145 family)
MKQLLFLAGWLMTLGLLAQAPQSIPYQAVVRNTDGSVMSNTSLTMTFKIHDVSATGTVVYEETHGTTSNAQGLVILNIGAGTAVTGTFTGINWGSGAKFLHVLMNNGSGNVDLGAQQMMSVPYALHAEAVKVRVSTSGDSLFIGDQFSIVPGVSAANPLSISNYGSVLLTGNTTCQSEFISVTGCGGQDSLLYYDRYYNLVEIGGQCWFAENLATDKYRNGDMIPTLPNSEWWNTTSGAYGIYDNLPINDEIYGKLYNWYTVIDTRNICPVGWHVPSDCEWMFLENSIGMSISAQESYDFRGTVEGGYLKSISYWGTPNVGATNTTGFSGYGGGYKNLDGSYNIMGAGGQWWTSTEYDISNSLLRLLGRANSKIGRSQYVKVSGNSIRCLKD